MVVLIDNGHGAETPGKRSPDGRVLEFSYTRLLSDWVVAMLKDENIETHLVTPENEDIKLSERCRRINEFCRERGTGNCMAVSLHINASGNGSQWMSATGWSAHISMNAGAGSKRLAECLADAAKEAGLKTRQPAADQKYWRQNLAICRDTLCAAVLTENLFMDSRSDVEYLLTEEGMKTLARIHVQAIKKYIGR
ncbi:MAG: N-acetylmuramoyl-L-alanine amidase [Fibrobacter sp.]|nr:N-acetylmuramoyl-L-alanine amidase [Fibrobacter sp.]